MCIYTWRTNDFILLIECFNYLRMKIKFDHVQHGIGILQMHAYKANKIDNQNIF